MAAILRFMETTKPLDEAPAEVPISEAPLLTEHDSHNAAGHTAPLEGASRVSHRRILSIGNRKIVTDGLPNLFWHDIYHYAMTATWPAFFLVMAVIFMVANGLFAFLYLTAPAGIANQSPPGFLGAFFFSVETFATVGYGDMHPVTPLAHTISTVEIFCGMSFVALFTGVMFARFSRPRARILFADHPVVGPFDGRPTLIIRAANARQNVIVDASARLRMLRYETTLEGETMRRVYDMKLVRETHPMFVIGWNIMHVIDKSSPLFSLTPADLERDGVGFILTIDGVDETTSQPMQSRFTYSHDAVHWNHRYEDLLSTDENGIDHLNYARFHMTQPIDAKTGKPTGEKATGRKVTDDASDEGETSA